MFVRRSALESAQEGAEVARAAELGVPAVILCSRRDAACPWSMCHPYFQAMADRGVPAPVRFSCVLGTLSRGFRGSDGDDDVVMMAMMSASEVDGGVPTAMTTMVIR